MYIGRRSEVDAYLVSRGPASFLSGLHQRLMLTDIEAGEAGSTYNIPLINALVFYCGIQVRHAPNSTPSAPLLPVPAEQLSGGFVISAESVLAVFLVPVSRRWGLWTGGGLELRRVTPGRARSPPTGMYARVYGCDNTCMSDPCTQRRMYE